MTNAPRRRKASLAAGGALALLSILGWLSCQPGELPCDSSPQWQEVCLEAMTGTGGTGGAPTGGTGGTPPGLSDSTSIADCAQWKTLGEMDAFFSARCGVNNLCHGDRSAWTVMPTEGVWEKFTTESTSKAALSCGGGRLVNQTAWAESVLWTKTQTPASCPPGTNNVVGLTMPPQMGYEPKMDPLRPEELKCLEGFLRAIARQ
jgi:hypothetical protein